MVERFAWTKGRGRVVDENVQPAEGLLGKGHQATHLLFHPHIRREESRAPARLSICCRTSCPRSWWMSETTTAAPSLARRWAITRPHPTPPDPVTIATLRCIVMLPPDTVR